MAQGRLATLPEVTEMHRTFTPPVEQSPVVYQIVLDLQIVVADSCTSSLQTIEPLVDKYMHMTTVPVVKLPTINLATNPNATGASPNCAQFDGRDAAGDRHGRRRLAAGLELPPDAPAVSLPLLQQSELSAVEDADGFAAGSLQRADGSGALRSADVFLAVQSGLRSGHRAHLVDVVTAWQQADDPSFETTLAMYVAANLPYKSQTYDSYSPVPLLTADEVAMYDGGFYKICRSSPQVQPASASGYSGYYGRTSWPIKVSDPPGYYVFLPQQVAVPGPSFTAESASVEFQICTAYCDHPYVSTAGTGESSWQTSPRCAVVK